MRLGLLLSVPAVLLLAGAASAQWAERGGPYSQSPGAQDGFTVRGQISSENALLGSVTVELVGNGRGISQTTGLMGDGSFEFHYVTPGQYALRLTGAGGGVLHEEQVIITGPNQNLSIAMNAPRGPDHSGGGTVSIRQLEHKISPEALKEYDKGQKAARKGDHALALDHFQQAVDADPEFADAYNNLGAAQAALGRLDDAAAEFQKAVDLVPDHSQAIANLSIVLCKLKRFDEAAAAARKALRLDPRLSNVRYILAVTLSRQQGQEEEALENLERAAPDIPKARLLAADILTRTGRLDEAAGQLEQYLLAAPQQDADRPNVQEWLSTLRHP